MQTEIYGLQLADYDTGYEKVSPAPMIVAGQGEDGANYTLIRVFNSSQACISQFLAFPPEVKGGVLVKAGTCVFRAGADCCRGLRCLQKCGKNY